MFIFYFGTVYQHTLWRLFRAQALIRHKTIPLYLSTHACCACCTRIKQVTFHYFSFWKFFGNIILPKVGKIIKQLIPKYQSTLNLLPHIFHMHILFSVGDCVSILFKLFRDFFLNISMLKEIHVLHEQLIDSGVLCIAHGMGKSLCSKYR